MYPLVLGLGWPLGYLDITCAIIDFMRTLHTHIFPRAPQLHKTPQDIGNMDFIASRGCLILRGSGYVFWGTLHARLQGFYFGEVLSGLC